MRGELNTEISNAIHLLGLSEEDIKLLSNEEGVSVYKDCLQHFVTSGDRRWWWEDFKLPYFEFPKSEMPFNHLNDILPDPEEHVWFIAEDVHEPYYPVYDAKAGILKNIIAECFGFEYYIISKDKEWLICETHHHNLFGIGERLRSKNGHQ